MSTLKKNIEESSKAKKSLLKIEKKINYAISKIYSKIKFGKKNVMR